ncbi:MAG: Nramp family divalent metal transporter [Bacteroidetes bacterium]|nr:Nramp family divalent metal transporter [Bacteroidota bacterium]
MNLRPSGDILSKVEVQNKKSKWQKILSFFGPAYLISVGYMDPGNWATDIAGGSQFGYKLIWVLLLSNIIALLLQGLSARLGIVRGMDLAQCNREHYPRALNFVLYLFAEIAIAACDLAELLGMAIGLQLLFGLDLFWGVTISFADTLLLMLLQRYGMRKMELFIVGLIFIIGMCFLIQIFIAKPEWNEVAKGLIPTIPGYQALYIAIGIIGATVMPHNLYLHSALVQTRNFKQDETSIRKAIKYNFWDTAIALNLAFFVNAAILILAAAVFHNNGLKEVVELEDAHKLLAPLLGSNLAPILFAVALIAAGQSSTVTGTLAGQIVMEGYLQIRINPVFRRLITRLLAIIPAYIVIVISHEKGVGNLLILSQVILSIQLAFAVIPLIHFVSDKKTMKDFVISTKTKILSWFITLIIVVLNFKLVFDQTAIWISNSQNIWFKLMLIGLCAILVVILLLIVFNPKLKKRRHSDTVHTPITELNIINGNHFKRIALAVDFSPTDDKVLSYGIKFASADTELILIHVSESASPLVLGHNSEDHEIRTDRDIMESYIELLRKNNFQASYVLGYRNRHQSIAEHCKNQNAELLIMGSHGHHIFKDFIFGETVNKVRHLVDIPVFIAK